MLASRLQVSWQDASESGRQEGQTRTHHNLLEVRQLTYTAAGEDPKRSLFLPLPWAALTPQGLPSRAGFAQIEVTLVDPCS